MKKNVFVIKIMLRFFELVSALKVNFYKSSFGAIGLDRDTLEDFAELLNCRLMSFPFTYLGLRMGANLIKEQMWRNIVKKFEPKLSAWKHKILSFAGRVSH